MSVIGNICHYFFSAILCDNLPAIGAKNKMDGTTIRNAIVKLTSHLDIKFSGKPILYAVKINEIMDALNNAIMTANRILCFMYMLL